MLIGSAWVSPPDQTRALQQGALGWRVRADAARPIKVAIAGSNSLTAFDGFHEGRSLDVD